MRRSKHLPLNCIPSADVDLFREAYMPGDIFEDSGGRGAHFTFGMRKMVETAYRRWLGFLGKEHPHELALAPAQRITRKRVSEYVRLLLEDMKPVSAAICVEGLFYVAGFAAPAADWRWLLRIAARLRSRSPLEDRFTGLIPGWLTLDHGIGLMDEALELPCKAGLARETLYRDG